MRIRRFSLFIKGHLEPFVLQDTDLVIDGQNFLYNAYSDSNLPYAFGAESDKFADYLRQYLDKFKRANVKCFFIFKGGHGDILTKFKSLHDDDREKAAAFMPGNRCQKGNIARPVFIKDIYKQVLDEMGFHYSVSTFEAKADCVALARKLDCPILSNDVEFCFLGVPYIPYQELEFDQCINAFQCGIFYLTDFMKSLHLNEEKLAMFVVLMDENCFPENFFAAFMRSVNISTHFRYRIAETLIWLSKTQEKQAREKIFRCIDEESKKKFLTKLEYFTDFINLKPPITATASYMEDNNVVKVERNDTEWFQKGVCLKNIPIKYVNLYRWKYMFGSWAIEDLEEDALFFSVDIIKYALDLLTNFQNESLTFFSHETKEIHIETSVQKPEYEATVSVFENGWTNIRKLKLFEHFLAESLVKFDATNLEALFEEEKLLMIALVYFSLRKENTVEKEVHSVLLSHVMLGVVFEMINNNLTGDHAVTVRDCKTAASAMDKYFQLTPEEERKIFDRTTVHPLVQFQHCLQQLNFLNTLCGKSFKPTVYHKTYNATFVYKILYHLMKQRDGEEKEFIKSLLKPAPTVSNYFNRLVKIYDKTMSPMINA